MLRRYTEYIDVELSLPPLEFPSVGPLRLRLTWDFFRTLDHPDSFDPAEVLDVSVITSKVTSVHSRRNSYLFRRLTVIIRESLQSGFTSMSSDISGVKKTVADQAAEI